jgi:hypothetical protein
MAQTSNEYELAPPERTLGLEEENLFLCVMFSSSEIKTQCAKQIADRWLTVKALFIVFKSFSIVLPEGLLDTFSILGRQQTQDLLAYGRTWRRRKSGGINPQSPVRSAANKKHQAGKCACFTSRTDASAQSAEKLDSS